MLLKGVVMNTYDYTVVVQRPHFKKPARHSLFIQAKDAASAKKKIEKNMKDMYGPRITVKFKLKHTYKD